MGSTQDPPLSVCHLLTRMAVWLCHAARKKNELQPERFYCFIHNYSTVPQANKRLL